MCGVGSKVFCVGGDICKFYDEGKVGWEYFYLFYSNEYRTNVHIKRYGKFYIAFIDGIMMGGGVGFSVHGTYRVAIENTVFAMPETGIGLFPDVGGSHFLSRCPGQIGMYLALTGARMKVADCIYAGVADAFVSSVDLDGLETALDGADLSSGKAAVAAVVGRFQKDPGSAIFAL